MKHTHKTAEKCIKELSENGYEFMVQEYMGAAPYINKELRKSAYVTRINPSEYQINTMTW